MLLHSLHSRGEGKWSHGVRGNGRTALVCRHRLAPDRRGRAALPRPGVITQRAAVGLTVEPKVRALVRARFLWHFPYLERIQGVLDGVPRGLVGPPGPLGLAALPATRHGPYVSRFRKRLGAATSATLYAGISQTCPGQKPPFSVVKRGLVNFYSSK
jgi:hypothetical protein